MKSITLAVLACVLLGTAYAGTNWAVLVAGSNGWYNYRHQADIYHSYQILKSHGFPDSNIVVMHYDDIGHNSQNPTPNVVINKPNGPDNYHGVPKDYTGNQCTAANFLKVLSGNSAAGGKVINSGPNDRIFVYYSDHGAPGLVAMPVGPYLYAKDLIATINSMYQNKKYAQMVLYVEACESGSMFDKILANNINVFATTAANPSESSYAFYYDSTRGTYLGDEYSIRWMEDSDIADFNGETLQAQFLNVQKQTVESHVCEYGDLTIAGNETLKYFQAFQQATSKPTKTSGSSSGIRADSRDVKLDILTRRWLEARPEDKAAAEAEMRMEIEERSKADRIFENIVSMAAPKALVNKMMTGNAQVADHDCLKEHVEAIRSTCGFSDYSLKHVQKIVNMCESDYVDNSAIMQAIKANCA